MLAAALAALAVATPAAASPAPTVEQAALGSVSATFTYTKTGDFEYRGMRVQVTRGGVSAYDAVAAPPDCPQPYCAPLGSVDERSLKVVDLDGDGEPEVLVDLYTGGAHCCVVTEVLRWDGARYVLTTRNFADFGYTLDGGTFVTGDARFAYSFAAFAFSVLPVRLLTFSGGRWTDVTRAHPETLRAEAGRLMKEYRKYRRGRRSLGVLAGWVADEYRLGRRAQADAFLRGELRHGRLRSEAPWPGGKAYIKALQRRLRMWGYTR